MEEKIMKEGVNRRSGRRSNKKEKEGMEKKIKKEGFRRRRIEGRG